MISNNGKLVISSLKEDVTKTAVLDTSDVAVGAVELDCINDVIPPNDAEDDDEDFDLPYPGFVGRAFFYLDQTTPPRNWCLKTITLPYPFCSFISAV